MIGGLSHPSIRRILISKYWDIPRTASHNCLFNFILGIRGAGKTYGMLKYLIERNIKYGYNFLYLRRSEEELKKIGRAHV